jgi:purine-binding chemotaxis protein CheW
MNDNTPNTKQYCTFLLDGLFCGVEVKKVQEVIRFLPITETPLAPSEVAGLINLRGEIVTAIDLRKRLGRQSMPEGRLPMNVIMRTDDGAVSFLVDEIGDVIEVSEDCFEISPPTLTGAISKLIVGTYKLKGSLLLVLNSDLAMDIQDMGSSDV